MRLQIWTNLKKQVRAFTWASRTVGDAPIKPKPTYIYSAVFRSNLWLMNMCINASFYLEIRFVVNKQQHIFGKQSHQNGSKKTKNFENTHHQWQAVVIRTFWASKFFKLMMGLLQERCKVLCPVHKCRSSHKLKGSQLKHFRILCLYLTSTLRHKCTAQSQRVGSVTLSRRLLLRKTLKTLKNQREEDKHKTERWF